MCKCLKAALCAGLVVLLMAGTAAANIVILQIEVVPGFAIEVPSNLAFPAVAPGKTSESELDIVVWANTAWVLMARTMEDGGLVGELEFREQSGNWHPVGAVDRMVYEAMYATTAEGAAVQIPFRFRANYADAPGDYNVRLELTVVPNI